MRAAVAVGGAVLGAVMLVGGCGGTSTGAPHVTATGAGASASVGAGGSLAGPCRSLENTLRSIPSRLRQAAAASNPTQTVPQTLNTIEHQLTTEAGNASGDLRTAVEDYVSQLRQVASTVRHGHRPDLSKLSTTRIDNACMSGGGVTATVSPTATATTSTG